jgi:hypothetical protein
MDSDGSSQSIWQAKEVHIYQPQYGNKWAFWTVLQCYLTSCLQLLSYVP